jgi:hypothetical protein
MPIEEVITAGPPVAITPDYSKTTFQSLHGHVGILVVDRGWRLQELLYRMGNVYRPASTGDSVLLADRVQSIPTCCRLAASTYSPPKICMIC